MEENPMEITILRFFLKGAISKPFTWTRNALPHQMAVAGLSGLLASVLFAGMAFGQIGSPAPSTAPPQSVPPDLLWYFFLKSVNNHDRAAVKFQLKGLDGTWIRDLHQMKLGFTPAQFAPIRASAQLLEAEIKQVDASARASSNPGSSANPGEQAQASQAQPAPPAANGLSPGRDAVVQSVVANLKTALGPQLTATLEAYISTRIAANVTTQKKEVVQ